MRKSLLIASIVAAGALPLFSGCTRTVYVQSPPPPPGAAVEVAPVEGPPPPQTEVIMPSPGLGYVWVDGYWGWVGGRWAWSGGHWVLPPYRGAVWIGPRWVHRGHGYVLVRGHWR